jgi:antitoxin component YwqK of YwqJK toxin-antitoxin module
LWASFKTTPMKRQITILYLLFLSITTFGQNQDERVLYIVDSIPVIEEPKKGFGTLTENEIEKVDVVKDKKLLQLKGYKDIDGIIYVFTKEYSKRSDSLKLIASTKKMTKVNGTWYLKDSTPFTGIFIDYYLNGKKEGEGYLFNGKLKGKRLLYYPDGTTSDDVEYENGLQNGNEQRYFKDGTLMQTGQYKNGKEIGIWEMYHSNGTLKQRSNFNNNGKMDGVSISYYSTGEIKGKNNYVNGIYQKDKINDKLFELYNESQELYKQMDFKGAIKKLDAALKIEPNWSDGYFARGTMKLNNFQFEEATEDFDKTLQIEPFFTNAYANRAFTIIRKYEFGDSRTLSKTKDVQVFATKKVEIPELDIEKICLDLNKAVQLGDTNSMVLEALKKHCKK